MFQIKNQILFIFNYILYKKDMSKDLLFSIYNKVKRKGVLDDKLINYLDSLFSERIIDVIEVIERGFHKYIFNPSKKSIWIISTRADLQKNYFLYPKLYCSCWDFYRRVVIEKKRLVCQHLLAQTICDPLDRYEVVCLSDQDFPSYVDKWELNF